MADFLLELLSEEIPARMQAKAREDLARLFAAEIGKAGLKAEAVETFSTPRRLALIARGLPAETEAVREELKGPRTSAPPQALEGFLRKTGLSEDQLTDRDGVWFAAIDKPGRPTATVLAEAIPAIIRGFPWPKSMRWGAASLSTESLRWVRPLQGIVALFGEEIVAVEIDGIASGAATVGHRFHHPGRITIGSAEDYAAKLRACHVIVDHEEREAIIATGATTVAAQAGLTLVRDEALLRENAGLTEWPVPLLGSFDPGFLQVPPEVIQLTMATNQKYFACLGADGKLAPNFICTANVEPRDQGHAIVAGNRKVLAARLADAKFFWEQDLKVPLEDQRPKLEKIVFHEKLGTVADKVDRVAKLARWLVEEGIVPAEDSARPERSRGAHEQSSEPRPSTTLGTGELADMAEQAARLCKVDLVTGMVGEFPELQGVMGGYYARAQGLPSQVADAIRDHYKPVGQGDDVPTAPVTVAVSLADKLDTVGLFFSAGKYPTGSKDPFALRRAALAIIRLVLENGIRASTSSLLLEVRRLWIESLGGYPAMFAGVDSDGIMLWEVLDQTHAYRATKQLVYFGDYSDSPELGQNYDFDSYRTDARITAVVESPRDFVEAAKVFIADRLQVQQREAGIRHDIIDAVFTLGADDDLVRLLARVRALQSFVDTSEGRDLLAGYKRAANILKRENYNPSSLTGDGEVQGIPQTGEEDPFVMAEDLRDALATNSLSYTPAPEEQSLLAALDSAEPRARAAVEREDFEGAMAALASLRTPVDSFFEAVTVNDPDPAKREARLNLLARVRDAVHQVADFSRIEG